MKNEKLNKRIELHCHSKAGGNATVYPGEIISRLSDMGMPAVAITDTSSIIAFPEIECVWSTGKYNTRPIYGMEALIEGDANSEKYNVSILIKNEAGKEDLYKLISSATPGDVYPTFVYHDFDEIRSNLLIGSGNDLGKLYVRVMDNATDEEIESIIKEYDYIELLPGCKFESVNIRILRICDKLEVPAVAVSNAYCIDSEDETVVEIIKRCKEDSYIGSSSHILTTDEMLSSLSYLGEEKAYEVVVKNTHLIAGKCETLEITPKERQYPYKEGADEELRCICEKAISTKYPHNNEEATERLNQELEYIKVSGLSTTILLEKELFNRENLRPCDFSTRGSGGGSLIVYLLGLSEVDPLKYNLSPELIFGANGSRLLDVDFNLSIVAQKKIVDRLINLESLEKAAYGGTIATISESQAESMIEIYEEKEEIRFVQEQRDKIRLKIVGNYRGRGKHPGGIILFPKGLDPEKKTPFATQEDGTITTYFDYHSIDRAYLKIDLLRHYSHDMLQSLSEKTGIDISTIPVECDEVFELFNVNEEGKVIGCQNLPEFRNQHIRDIIAKLNASSFSDLVKVISLAHSTCAWEENGKILIEEKGLSINDLIATRDDVFDYLIERGIERMTAFSISEAVRKGIIRRGRNAKWADWKKTMEKAGIPDWFIWSCGQTLYLFPRAHSISYLLVNLRLGWFEVHYPEEYKQVLEEFSNYFNAYM